MNEKRLVEEAKKARQHAYVPYSKFEVGAALLMEDGTIYHGANIENASYGLSNCAERTALFKAYSEGKQNVQAVAIVANTERPLPPCGACRQVMVELCSPNTAVILANMNDDIMITTVEKLLPGAFTAEDFYEQ